MDASLLTPLSRNWGWILFRGLLAILFGLLAFTWPVLTLKVLVILFGAYALVDGVAALVAAIQGGAALPRWWLALTGLASIVAGIVVFLWPGPSAFALLLFIGAMSVIRGLFEIIGAVALRKEIAGEGWLILGGVVSVFFGLVVILFPGGGAVAMVWLIAAYAIAFGLALALLAFRLRRHARAPAAV